MKKIRILGTRGIPAAHGGFETFAEHLALYLAEQGWSVTVYNQADDGYKIWEDEWCGVRRVHIPVKLKGSIATIIFDLKSTLHAARESDLILTLGYNTAVFCLIYRLKGICNLINMDGLEWQRAKWPKPVQAWFYINERFGCWLGNHLIADNPGIVDHLLTRVSPDKITMIPYGADAADKVDKSVLSTYGLEPGEYLTLIARPEPENSVLEIVKAFSRKPRGKTLLVLGKYDETHTYQKAVLESASAEVKFVGAIYDKQVVKSLRYFCAVYIHGHQVGGTNPSLIEAMGVGNPVLANDNKFNRWVAGEAARYFHDEESCAIQLDAILNDPQLLLSMSENILARYKAEFTWEHVLSDYEALLTKWL
ncbi:DUF1972 domain-containing protein [Methylomonas sp. AM2-LC]|uniref:DUF1972 domain-containing protein n=1 Tax=Methylomonas sp. AM2-LC TaxID=3153301 RepID=UPI00326676EE